METAIISPVNEPRSKKVRSKLSNGSKLLPMTDGRSATARRFRDLFEDICGDLGGCDLLSEGQRQLAKRAALLSAECERLEALAVRDERSRTDIKWKDEAASVFDLETYVSFAIGLVAYSSASAVSAVRVLSTTPSSSISPSRRSAGHDCAGPNHLHHASCAYCSGLLRSAA